MLYTDRGLFETSIHIDFECLGEHKQVAAVSAELEIPLQSTSFLDVTSVFVALMSSDKSVADSKILPQAREWVSRVGEEPSMKML